MRYFAEWIFAYDVFTMRKIIDYILFGFTFLLTLSACGKVEIESSIDQPLYPEATVGEVRLVLPDGATRAHFEPNEGNTRATVTDDGRFLWQSGDRFRLYAHNSDGSNAFPADSYIDFSYWINTTSVGRSFFRGTITEDMSDGSYTYYAVYPHSTPVEGTTATFTLPATQSGEYSRYDFMVARSTAANSATASGNALQAIQDNDPYTPEPMNDIALSFKHKLHALRFEIPSQGVLTSGIRRVHILFSEVVVGDVVVNMATDEVSYTNMTNKITVDFGAGNEKHSGDVFWVMTLPQTSFSRAVDIRFEDSNGNFTTRQLVTFPSSQQYTAGRLTPIKINVPTQYVGYTYLDATTVDTNLGESVTHLHLDLPVGYYFPDYSQKYIAAENGEIHTFTLFNDIIDKTFRDSNITLTYESEHALIPTTTSFGDGLKVGQRNQYYGLETPWLFYEDFNNMTDNVDKTDDESGQAIGAGLDGWSGSKFKTDKSRGILQLTTYIGSMSSGGTDILFGRLDSPRLTNIKKGKSAKIQVKFDLGLTYGTKYVLGVFHKSDNAHAQCVFGSSTYSDSNATPGGGSIGFAGLGNTKSGPDNVAKTYNDKNAKVEDDNRTYTINNTDLQPTIDNCTSDTRITWFNDFYHAKGLPTALYMYLFLDNVRVSIAQ